MMLKTSSRSSFFRHKSLYCVQHHIIRHNQLICTWKPIAIIMIICAQDADNLSWHSIASCGFPKALMECGIPSAIWRRVPADGCVANKANATQKAVANRSNAMYYGYTKSQGHLQLLQTIVGGDSQCIVADLFQEWETRIDGVLCLKRTVINKPASH